MKWPWVILLALAPAALADDASHPVLLPKPQRITYQNGALKLQGLSIRRDARTPEDSWTAGDLAARISRRTGVTVSVRESPVRGAEIVLKRTGPVDALPKDGETSGPDSRESYKLVITASHAEIQARSSAGLFYGAQTLTQLIEGSGASASLPAVEIVDWPSLPYRGFMMDLSHGPLPTEDEIERQIDFLSRWKGNQYYFYSEANIELEGFPLLNPQARYTRDQVHRIVDYAHQRHVEVVPCLELYGHLHDLLRVERYADLAALPHSGEIDPRLPQVAELLGRMVAQVAALFPGPWMHIGMDEPWELERAASAHQVDPTQLFMGQLKRMTALVREQGKRPMFWADVKSGARIFSRYPELVSQLPAGTIAVPWYYYPEKDYEPIVGPLSKLNVPFIGAPAIWCWDLVTPDFLRSFENIDQMTAATRQYGGLGIMNTGWTDAAQVLYRTALPGIAYGAAAAWQNDPIDRGAFFANYARISYRPAIAAEVAAALEALSQAQPELESALGSETSFRMWDDPLYPDRIRKAQQNREKLHHVRLLAEEADEHLQRAMKDDDDSGSLPALLVGARMLDYTGMKYLYTAEIADDFHRLGSHPKRSDLQFYLATQSSSRNHSRIEDLMDSIGDLANDYRAAWEREYTPHRLNSVLGRWSAEREYWRSLQTRFWEFLRNFKEGDALPPLESFRPRGAPVSTPGPS